MITLKQLHYFNALARHLHFARAAEECAISQPALSMQIRELEISLNTTLVERSKSSIHLTPTGQEILTRAQDILNQVKDLQDYAQCKEKLLSGELKLGVIPTISPYMLPKALPKLKKLYPDMQLKIRESKTSTLIEELKKGKLDIALLAIPIEDNDLHNHELFTDRFLLAAANTKDKQNPYDILNDKDLLLLEEGHCLRDQILAFCHAEKPEALSNFGATSLSTIIQMITNDYGSTLIPELAQKIELGKKQSVKLFRFPDPQPQRTIGLVWRKSSPRGNDFLALGEVFQEIGNRVIDEVVV